MEKEEIRTRLSQIREETKVLREQLDEIEKQDRVEYMKSLLGKCFSDVTTDEERYINLYKVINIDIESPSQGLIILKIYNWSEKLFGIDHTVYSYNWFDDDCDYKEISEELFQKEVCNIEAKM